jgi:uncharacterized integral membrane protein
MRAKMIAILVLLSLLLIFAIQKTQPVVLNFLYWHIFTSSLIFILVSFIIVLLTVCLLMMIVRVKKKSPRLDYSRSNLLQFLLARCLEKVLMCQAKSLKKE